MEGAVLGATKDLRLSFTGVTGIRVVIALFAAVEDADGEQEDPAQELGEDPGQELGEPCFGQPATSSARSRFPTMHADSDAPSRGVTGSGSVGAADSGARRGERPAWRHRRDPGPHGRRDSSNPRPNVA